MTFRWSTARGVEPRVDANNSLISSSVSRENGFTTISFIRRVDTRDTDDDLDLSDNLFFVYGWGGTVDFDSNRIQQHPLTPMVSQEEITIPASILDCPGIFLYIHEIFSIMYCDFFCTGEFEEFGGVGMTTVSILLLVFSTISAYLMM